MPMSEIDNAIDERLNKDLNELAELEKFKHENIGTCADGRSKVQITCRNEYLDHDVSVVLNDDSIGIFPYFEGHIAKMNVQGIKEVNITLYGYFPGMIRSSDEVEYIEGVVKTLRSGATNDFFGSYG